MKRTVSGIATVHFVPLGCANDVELAKVSGHQSILDFRVYGATLEKRVQIERQSATHSARLCSTSDEESSFFPLMASFWIRGRQTAC